jgi:hypothetical protein
MTEEGLFAREPNIEYTLLVKVKERRVIMAVKHPTDTPAEGEGAGPDILLCSSVARSKRDDAVEIWSFVLPFDQRDIDFGAYTFEGFEPKQIELACRGAGLWQDREATFERENLQPWQVDVAREFFDRFRERRQ